MSASNGTPATLVGARRAWHQAVTILDELRDPAAATLRAEVRRAAEV
jgi:hypothetical protein